MIVIPKVYRVKVNEHAKVNKKYWTYDYLYTTKNLVVYKCRETGHTETFQKKDFFKKEEESTNE